MRNRYAVVIGALLAGSIIGVPPLAAPASYGAAPQKKPTVTEQNRPSAKRRARH